MADVFVSYVHDDRATAERISRALEAAGYSVWWDRDIRGGADFSTEIERQITAARVVLVLWSIASLESKWVRDEASYARDENKLIPLRLDAAQPPFGFRQVQSLDFNGWDGATNASAFAKLVASVGHYATRTPSESTAIAMAPPIPTRNTRFGKLPLLAVAGTLTVVAIAAGVWFRIGHIVDAPPVNVFDIRYEIGNFKPLSSSEEVTRFADELPDSIARGMARNDGLKIVARDPGGAITPAEFLIRGSVDQEDTTLVASIDLVHQHEGLVTWSTTMRGEARDAKRFQQRIANALTRVLGCTAYFTLNGLFSRSTYVMHPIHQFCAQLEADQPDRLNEEAKDIVQQVPQSALAQAVSAVGIAAAFVPTLQIHKAFGVSAPTLRWTPKPDAELARLRSTANAAAKMALQIQPEGAPAVLTKLALALVADPPRGLEQERLLKDCVATDVYARWCYASYALFLDRVGREHEARAWYQRAGYEWLWDPLIGAAYLAAAAGEIASARDQFKLARTRSAEDWSDDNVPGWFEAEHWWGDPKTALTMAAANPDLARAYDHTDRDASPCLGAFLNARSNKSELSEDQINAACASGWHQLPASIYAYFGHVDAAYRNMESIADWNAPIFALERELFRPQMRSVRADPRFMHFAAKLHLVDYWLAADQWPDFCTTEDLPYNCKDAALAARASIEKVAP